MWVGLGTTVFSTTGNDVIWYKDKFIAVGSGNNSVAYSLDGITWTGLGLLICNNISNNSNIVIATATLINYTVLVGSNQRISYDLGTTWSSFSISGNPSIQQIANNGNFFVAFSSTSIYYSYNGTTWVSSGSVSSLMLSVYSLAYGNNKWVIIGQGTNTIAYSNNGTQWTGLGKTLLINIDRGYVEYGNGIWVAIGSNGSPGANEIIYSYDAITWTSTGIDTYFSSNCSTAKYGNGLWIAVGGYNNCIIYSTNGTQWIGLGSSFVIFDNVMTDVAYGNGIWVVSHNGNNSSLAYSYNGTQWTGLGTTVGGSNIRITLKFSGNKFYGFPSSGVNTIFTSTNGTIWTGLGTTISPTTPS
ncbi:MAG: hypothetical protein EBX41_10065, partial [Chitinophagia bacterium]|nr:hypothetical protein [Chitinophagia bacterium]